MCSLLAATLASPQEKSQFSQDLPADWLLCRRQANAAAPATYLPAYLYQLFAISLVSFPVLPAWHFCTRLDFKAPAKSHRATQQVVFPRVSRRQQNKTHQVEHQEVVEVEENKKTQTMEA